MKKVLSILLILTLILLILPGCKKNEDRVKIGIVKIVEHPSLNTIEDSIISQLEELGYVDGKNAVIFKHSAQNETSNIPAILDTLVTDGVDVIVAITTPVASVALNYAEQIPVVFSAVSAPIEAGLTTSLEKPDKNITGTSDAVPVDKIIDKALEMVKGIETFGFIYNSAEDSSFANIKAAKSYCDEKGLKYVEANVENSTAIQQAAESLVTKCDAIFTPTDNTVAEGMDVLARVAIDSKTPCFVGADSMVKDGGLATIGITYEDLGIETADMVKLILDGTKVEDIPIKVFKDLSTYINITTAEKCDIKISDEILNAEDTVIFK